MEIDEVKYFLSLAGLAFLVILVALVAIGFARRVPALRKRRKLPRDPGMPKTPQGAPYRGPQ